VARRCAGRYGISVGTNERRRRPIVNAARWISIPPRLSPACPLGWQPLRSADRGGISVARRTRHKLLRVSTARTLACGTWAAALERASTRPGRLPSPGRFLRELDEQSSIYSSPGQPTPIAGCPSNSAAPGLQPGRLFCCPAGAIRVSAIAAAEAQAARRQRASVAAVDRQECEWRAGVAPRRPADLRGDRSFGPVTMDRPAVHVASRSPRLKGRKTALWSP